MLPRFHDYTGGHILLDGVELKDYPREYLRKQIGIVQQEPFLFSRSIRENIMYGIGRNVSNEEVERAAKAAAIHDVILTFPDGYNTLVGEKGVTLSGGQKQRVTIARTLLKNPRILILDDSTSSVDTETEAEIRAALYELMEDRTTFIIAHRIQSVMDADLILVLDKGKSSKWARMKNWWLMKMASIGKSMISKRGSMKNWKMKFHSKLIIDTARVASLLRLYGE